MIKAIRPKWRYRLRLLGTPFRWVRFWTGWARCPLGWHQYKVWHITDGSTSVWCLWCRKKREPTAKELASHPDVDYTLEQRAKQNAEVGAVLRWLDEHGYGERNVRTDPKQ